MAPNADRRSTGRTRRRWSGIAALGVLLAAFGLGGVQSPAQAQAPATGADLFGGFNLTGRSNGIQVSYNVENVFPLPPPLLQVSAPEALSTSQSGPIVADRRLRSGPHDRDAAKRLRSSADGTRPSLEAARCRPIAGAWIVVLVVDDLDNLRTALGEHIRELIRRRGRRHH